MTGNIIPSTARRGLAAFRAGGESPAPGVRGATIMGPASANLHNTGLTSPQQTAS
jgi:hypothetical protein